jgi:[amino group carrier protein]-lysine/ornithine hydrolase
MTAMTDSEAVERVVARLEGGIEEATTTLSCRTPPGFDAERFQRQLRALAGPALIEVDEVTPAVQVPRSSAIVRSLSAAIPRRGGSPALEVKTGTSDMNVVVGAWSVPMAPYGPGDSRLDHTARERIELPEYLRAVGVLTDALPALAMGGGG